MQLRAAAAALAAAAAWAALAVEAASLSTEALGRKALRVRPYSRMRVEHHLKDPGGGYVPGSSLHAKQERLRMEEQEARNNWGFNFGLRMPVWLRDWIGDFLKGPEAAHLSADVVEVTASSPEFPGPRRSARKALCISGGGSRAMSLTMGYYRALTSLGVLPGNVDAISSVSGGSWASSQYMFADVATDDLVGLPTSPKDATMAVLNRQPPAMGARATELTNKFVRQIFRESRHKCKGLIVDSIDWLQEKCQETYMAHLWQDIVGSGILGPYGLNGKAYMAPSPGAADAIKAKNPSLAGETFLSPLPGRPSTFVMNGVLAAPLNYNVDVSNAVSFQMSPDFTGSPYYPNGSTVNYQVARGGSFRKRHLHKDINNVLVGGGFVETFAFGGEAPEGCAGQACGLPAPRKPFTLSDAIGISSAAHASKTASILGLQTMNPNGLYWPVISDSQGQPSARTYQFADGGNQDNVGLLAMLQSGASQLAVFYSTSQAINTTMNVCFSSPGADLTAAATSDLSCFFGHCTGQSTSSFYYGNNQVFDSAEYAALLCSLQTEKSAGRPAIVKTSHKVRANPWWGIAGGADVEVIWFYNEHIKNLEDMLPQDTKAAIAAGEDGPFANYPLFATMFQNGKEALSLTAAQVNLLGMHGEYAVLQKRDLFCEMFGCTK